MSRQQDWRFAALLLAVLAVVAGCDRSVTPAAGVAAPDAATAPLPADSAATRPAERPVISETLPYAEVDNELVYGYFVFPADMVNPLPGVMVFHERWGLDDGTRALADRLAAQGYVVLALDLFGGKTAADSDAARALMLPVIENPDLAHDNIRQAYEFLVNSGQAPRVGTLGWSFGANWAFNAAILYADEIDAVVVYYGQLSTNEEKLAMLGAPLLGLFGANDRGVTVDTVREFEAALERLRKDYQIEIYEGAGHAFADPSAPNYQREVAEQAWEKMLDFLGAHLGADK